jgi:hypothetical protein
MSHDSQDLVWTNTKLRLRSGQPLATIEPDQLWPTMWRVRMHDGHLTDMINRTRAKDAAMSLVLADLNGRQSPREARLMRSSDFAASHESTHA